MSTSERSAPRDAVHPLMERFYAEPQRWRLRPASADDDAEVAGFLTQGFLHPFVYSVTLRFLQWLLRENPAGDGRGWVADVDGRLVGYGSWLPCRIRWRGTELGAFKIGPLCVAPEWRNQGLFLHLTDTCLRSILSPEYPLVFSLGSTGPVSRGLCKFLGCKVALELVEHVVPLRAEGMSDGSLPRPLRSPALKAISAAMLRLGAAVASQALRSLKGHGVRVRLSETPDPEIETFLRDATQGYQWIVVRERQYVQWRYFLNPRHRYDFYVARRGERVCGYMVLNVNPNNEGIIVDLLTNIEDRIAYSALLAAAVDRFAADGVRSIRMYQHPGYWANPLVRRVLPFVRPHSMSLVARSLDGGVATPTPAEARGWHVCLGDTDDEGGLDQIFRPGAEPAVADRRAR